MQKDINCNSLMVNKGRVEGDSEVTSDNHVYIHAHVHTSLEYRRMD